MGWWIATSEHRLTETVPAAPTVVRDFYTDLGNLKSLHPFLVSVRTLQRTTTAEGYRETYEIRERIPLGPLTLPIKFTAVLEVPDGGPVRSDSRQFPQVRLHSVMAFDAADGATHISEHLLISAPRPLAGITVSDGVSAHIDMLAGIRRHFETISRS